MSKIINKRGEILAIDDNLNSYGIVRDSFYSCDMGITIFETLSDMVSTMTGDDCTPFNSLREMIDCFSDDILDCKEECAFAMITGLDVNGKDVNFYILGWDYENDEKLWTKIIKNYDPDVEVREN